MNYLIEIQFYFDNKAPTDKFQLSYRKLYTVLEDAHTHG